MARQIPDALHACVPDMIFGEIHCSAGTPKFKVVNRKPWLPADMGLSVKAAGAMYRWVCTFLFASARPN